MQNIHPLFVHFPIALLSVGLLCDILGSVFNKESLRSTGWWCQVFGTVAIISAAITGLLAESTIAHSEAAHEILKLHKTVLLTALVIFALLFLWRSIRRTRLPQTLPLLILYFIIGASAVGIMFFGAHLGGRLVYEFGVGGSAVQQSEEGEHQHDHDEAAESEAQHNHDIGTQDSIKDAVSSPVDTAPDEQKKIHIHEEGAEHTH